MKKYYKVLTIAGTDSGGGAGVPADIKAISACGGYAMCVITAVTAQNTLGVSAIHSIPPEIISAQIDAVFSDMGVDSVKIGMLHNAETVEVVANCLKKHNAKNIVLDPVMVSTSGSNLLENQAVKTLIEKLFPLAKVVTPNVPEAEVILQEKINGQQDIENIVKKLSEISKTSVLLKGGHFDDVDIFDVLYNVENKDVTKYPAKKIITKNTHGTGCTLSSAIATYLSQGYSLEKSIFYAKKYLNEAIISGADYQFGKGHGPVNHFYKFFNN